MAYLYKVQRVKNARFPEGDPVYSVSLKSNSNITLNQLKNEINDKCSFTQGDVSGVIDNIIILIANHISSGHTVTIDRLGTFWASGGLKEPVTDPDTITGNHIGLKRICFKPCPEFKKMIEKQISFIQK